MDTATLFCLWNPLNPMTTGFNRQIVDPLAGNLDRDFVEAHARASLANDAVLSTLAVEKSLVCHCEFAHKLLGVGAAFTGAYLKNFFHRCLLAYLRYAPSGQRFLPARPVRQPNPS